MSKRLRKLKLGTSVLHVLFFAILFTNTQQLLAQCNLLTDIGGFAFRDLPAIDPATANVYGQQEGNEPFMSGILVRATDANGVVQMDTTDAMGEWSLNPATFPVRVEFSWDDPHLELSTSGLGNNTTVRILNAANCGVNLAVHFPEEYCQMIPQVATACYVGGDPLGGGSTGSVDAIVSFPYNQTGDLAIPDKDADLSEVGAIWGMAYHPYRAEAFLAAVIKRHVGLGSLGIGGLYRLDYSGPSATASSFLDLSALGVDVGTEPTRVLANDYDAPNTDAQMFGQPGNIGLGDIDLSTDANTLFVVNLASQKIVTIDLSTYNNTGTIPSASEIDSLPTLPDPACTNGQSRMFGIKYYRGQLYAGVVCNGESGGTASDLSATVYVYDFTLGAWSIAVNTFSLGYTRGGVVDADCTTWMPWINTYDAATTNCHPSPMLSDIEFDVDGSMLLAFADRYTFQKFTLQRDVSNSASESVVNGGEILRVHFDGSNYALENNGTTAAGGGCGSNNQGPGNGEFYCGDFIGVEHSETAMGAAALLAGSGKLLLTVINPVNYNSGGIRLFDNITGNSSIADGYQLYNTPGITFPTGNGFAVKGGGLGDIELLCQPAPIEIGNSVWFDENGDGIRDADETGIADVEVSLFDLSGTLLGRDTTDGDGQFYFSSILDYSTDYYLAFGTDGGFDLADSTFNDSLFLSPPNGGSGPNADWINSDANLAQGIHAAIDGYPYIAVRTGRGGQNNHNLDVGFFECLTIDSPSAGETLCSGSTISPLQVSTNTMGVNSIAFVYFTSPQTGSDMYSGGTLLSYATPVGGIATVSNPLLPANNGTLPEDYYIYAIAQPTPMDVDCRPFQEIQIRINPASRITMGSNTPVCEEELLMLTESGGTATNWNWIGPNGFATSSQNPNIPLVTEMAQGRYYLTVTDANLCSNLDSIDVIIDTIPAVSLNSAGPFTDVDAPINLTAFPSGGMFSGTGITDVGMGTFDPAVAGGGTHTITYTFTDSKSCTNTAQIMITVTSTTPIIGDFVWLDSNGDGIQDIGEPGIENVMVILYDELANPLDTAWSDHSGAYAFSGQGMGNYYLLFEPSTNTSGYLNLQTTLDSVGANTTDSDLNPLTNQTTVFSYDPGGSTETGIDAGFFDCPVILNPASDMSLCGGELIPALQVSTNVTAINGIAFVYFTSPQSSADRYVGGLLLGNVTPFGGNALLGNVSLPTNNGPTPIDYYVYAIVNPTPALGICRPSQETVITVNPTTMANVISNSPLCAGETLSLSETGGDATNWLWSGPNSFSSAIPSPSIAGVSAASAGTYYVTVTDINSCTDVDSVMIVVNNLPAPTLDPAGPFCVSTAAVNLTGNPLGGTYAGPGIIDANAGTFDPATAGVGMHSVEYSVTDANGCVGTANIIVEVEDIPTVSIGSIGPLCANGIPVTISSLPIGGTFSGTGITDANAGIFDPTIAMAGTHTITYSYTTAGGCTNFAARDIVVNALPVVSVNNAGPFCEDDGSVNLVGSPTGGTFSGPGITDGALGIFDPMTAGPGVHTISYSVADANGCVGTSTIDLTVHALPTVSINNVGSLCATDAAINLVGNPAGGTFSGPGITDVNAGTFDPAVALVGTHIISYTASDANGCTNSTILTIVVESVPTTSLDPAGPFCINSGTVNLVGNPVGGIYSGAGIIDVNTGLFDPATAGQGTHTITYTYTAGGCTDMSSIDIDINDLPVVALNSTGPFCLNEGTQTLIGSPMGGVFSGMGITDANAGTFDPATAGVGSHTLTYTFTDANGCSNDAMIVVEINDLPSGSLDAAGPFCIIDAATNLTASPSGGTFAGTGISDANAGTFDPNLAGIGLHTISYSFTDANGCTNTVMVAIEVMAEPTAVLPGAGPLCINGSSITLMGTPIGGSYSGVGITDVNAGTFDPTVAGLGTHTITYTFTVGSCTDQATIDIEVNDLPTGSINGIAPICANATIQTLTGTPPGGTFSGVGIVDANAGTFDPAIAGAGLHSISYTFTDANACSNTVSIDIEVLDLPGVSINTSNSFCNTISAVTLTGLPSGGVFSGMGITDPNAGTFAPTVAGVGSHTISYTFTDANGCSNTAQRIIDVVDCSGAIGDFVWLDDNANGIQDLGENGLENVQVIIVDANTDLALDTVYSDNIGSFNFSGILAGSYYLIFDPTGNANGFNNLVGTLPGAGTALEDSDIDPLTGQTPSFSYDPFNGAESTIDAGFYSGGSIGSFAWTDTNGDGIQGGGEPGLANVRAILFDANTNLPIDSVVTNVQGQYAFETLPVGSYYIRFDESLLFLSYRFSPQNQGSDPLLDSDVDPNTGQTSNLNIQVGSNLDAIDVGLIPVGTIGDFVWADANGDGLQDIGELGIEGVRITLYDNNTDTIVATTQSNGIGRFAFIDVGSGSYYLGFDPSTNTAGANYQGTLQDAGPDDLDSDADPNTGLTNPFSFAPSLGDFTQIDAGFLLVCPSVDAGTEVTICENTDAQLLASGGTTYIWSPTTGLSDPNIANPIAAPLNTTTYYVTVSDALGCMGVDSVLVNVLPIPVISTVVPTNPTACDLNDGQIAISATGGQAPLQFSIDGGNSFQFSSSFTGLVAGSYTVLVSNGNGACFSDPMTVNLSDETIICTDLLTADTVIIPVGSAPEYCFPIAISEIGNYEITINGVIYTDPVNTCLIDTMPSPGSQITLAGPGLYEMILRHRTTCCRDTQLIAVQTSVQPDTLLTIIPFELSSELCADDSELLGEISSITSCRLPQNGNLAFDGSACVTYTPNPMYSGVDTLCLTVCDDFGICDSTLMLIRVLPEACPDFIDADSSMLNLTDCSQDASLCLNLSLGEIGNYQIMDNGLPYTGGLQACDFDTTYVYTYFGLPGLGLAGPYTLDAWTVDGTVYFGAIADVNALVDSMNVWDPLGNWNLDMNNSSISGGVSTSSYGSMILTQDGSGTTTVLQRNISLTPIDTRLSFAQGSHQVVFMHAITGCSDTLQVDVVCDCPSIFTDPVDLTAVNCNALEVYCTPIAFTEIVNYSISDHGAPYTGGIVPCPDDPDFAAVRVDTGFHQLVFNHLSNGCLDTLELNVTCSACPDLFVESLILSVEDCNTTAEYCFAVPPNAINDYSVTDNGNVYTGGYQSCGNATIQTYITIGFNFPDDYTLDSWPVNGAVFSTPSFTTASDLVDSMNVWDPLGNWTLNGLIISGGFSGNTYGNLTISLNGIGVADVLPNPQMVETHTSMVLDTGFHELVLTNNVSGCAETVLVTVNCSTPVDCTPLLDVDFLETHIGDCFEQTAVCLPTPLEEVIRYELTNNGNLYQGLVEGCNFDSLLTYAYLTLPGGGNTGPYNLNEWIVNGTTFSGEFLNVAALVDSMNVWDPSSNWTFDPTTLVISGANPANAYSSMSINQIGTGAFTSLDLNVQLRANGTQLNLGVGNHELIFTDNVNGCADTLMVSIWCLETTIVIDTLLVGDADVICLDTFELPGNVVSVQNVCAENAGDYLSFDLIDSVNCVVIQALDVGQDSACMVICDDQNLCDTTYFYYTALMDTMPPTAIADVDSTTQGQPIVINIQTNDGTQNIDTVFISNDPSFGTATVNGASGTVTYTPDPEYCNSVTPDSLTYVACNTFGCDSTTVSVYVFCNTINVMNGFSPNGDNRNDFFVIQGLEAFPDNVLRVYNRWGNLIYRMDGYDNSWNGRWEGKDLPDGTYFYVLSDGVGQTYSGYVQIHR